MAYKLNFYNTVTGEHFLSDETYETVTQADTQAIFLRENLQPTIILDGVVDVIDIPNTQVLSYDLTDDGTGKKYDSGKSMVGTLCRVFPRALLGVGQCIRFGQTKYPNPKNWSLVEDGFNRYTDSLMRHLLKMFAGQEIDPETKLPHVFHVCWNALAIAEFYIKDHPELDEVLLK